jgi:hypothetical protein
LPHYRLYFLDGAGHIRHAVDLECEGDEQAIAEVERHRDGRTMELWRRAELIRRFEPRDGVHPLTEPRPGREMP